MAENSRYISRRLPQTNIGRNTALDNALAKALNPGVHGNFLTGPVFTRLQNIVPLYNAASDLVDQKEDFLHANTPGLDASVSACRTACSVFVQGINTGIGFGFYQASNRSVYGLPIDTGKLPSLTSYDKVREFAQKLISGEALRVGAGGPPATFPPISFVQNALTPMLTFLGTQSNLNDDLDVTQEAVDALNTEANQVIKKVWDEVETFFNHEPPPSLRDNARQWGVVYVSNGAKVAITFNVSGGTLPQILQTRIIMKETGHKEVPDYESKAVFNTTILGPVEFIVKTPGFVTQIIPVLLDIETPQTINVVLQPL